MTATTTNGASLEDCLTNIFSLIDLNGIRWKRFKQKEQNNFLFTPIDTHPILTTYAKCIEENHIAAWRHEPLKRHSIGANSGGPGTTGGGGGTGSAGHSSFPTPTRTSNNNTPTSAGPSGSTGTTAGSGSNQSNNNNSNSNNQGGNTNNSNYELWIFGYGDQLKVDDVIGDDLVEIEDDEWEQKGLSYECRTILFKALHNLIDKCLTTKGFTRIGRWFVQPLSGSPDQSSCCHSATLPAPLRPFKHLKGEQSSSIIPPTPSSNIRMPTSNLNLSSRISTTINNFIDSMDTKRPFDKSDGLRHTSTRSSSTYFTTSLDGTKSSLSFSFSFFFHGNSTICTTIDVRQHPLIHPLTRSDLSVFQAGGIVRVALAPHGLNGILNGVSYKDSDNGAATTAFIQQWSKFYPLPKTLARLVPSTKVSATNSTMASSSNFQKAPTSNQSQFNQNNDGQGSRSYLSNLTNMLLPPASKPTFHFDHEPHEVPPVIEVIVAGFRMRYPSECVFTTSRVIDHYKTSQHLSSPSKTSHLPATKRSNKGSPIKPNKLSLLSEKTSEDKPGSQSSVRVKIEPMDVDEQTTIVSDNIFKISTTLPDSGNKSDNSSTSGITTITTSTINSTTITHMNLPQQPTYTDATNKDKTTINNSLDLEGGSITKNPNLIAQTTNSRYNSNTNTKVSGFTPNNAALGPADIVKLYPTPPSLEQIPSPSAILEESNATTKDQPVSKEANQNVMDIGIDIYKPVERAVMEPPSKWASIVIAGSQALPPGCIYRSSSQKNGLKEIVNKSCDTITSNTASQVNLKSSNKQLNSLLDKSTRNSPAAPVPSPLADQTNKNGFNMNPSIQKNYTLTNMSNNPATSTSSSIFSPQPSTQSPIINNQPSASIAPTIFSAYTLPHQRLFNNLNEVNSIQLNLSIADSALGMFQDHNFENCTLCVCNMSIKGNLPDTIPQKNDFSGNWRHSVNNDNANIPSAMGSSNEFLNECTCGFSSITNRHYSHLSGLFLEDELEITNILYDPTEMIDQNKLFRKLRLSTYSESSISEEQKAIAKLLANFESPPPPAGPTTANTKLPTTNKSIDESTKGSGGGPASGGTTNKAAITDEKSSQTSQNVMEEAKLFVIDQLKQQCTTMIHSNSSLSKVLMIESFRNNRHMTSCINYYAQAPNKIGQTSNPFHKFLDDTNKYTTVKMYNRNPCSLKFSDYCELIKNLVTKLGNQSQQQQQQNSRLSGQLVKSYPGGANPNGQPSNLSSIFLRMFGPNSRQPLIGKTLDSHANARSSIFVQGLRALVLPTLSIDPKGTLQMLEQLVKDEYKEALATLNKAILIFSSPIHDWQFITTPIPENNFDVANLLKILQPLLDDAVGLQNKLYKEYVHQKQQNDYTSRDSPSGAPVRPTPPCQGPLTWKQFHHAAGRGTEDQCEPQPIPSLLVGYHVDKSHMGVSPFALKFWDKLLLEPYAPGHNMYYLVIAPDNPSLSGHIYTFFRELSNIYELLKMGKHVPIGTGIITAPEVDDTSSANSLNDDSWFTKLGCDERDTTTQSVLAKIKSYANKLDATLGKSIVDFIEERQSTYDPHADRFDSSPSSGPQETKASLFSSTGSRTSHHPSQLLSQQLRPQQSKQINSILGIQPSLIPSATVVGTPQQLPSQQQQQQQPQQQSQPDTSFGASYLGTDQASPFETQQNQTAIKSQILINLNQAHNNNEDNTYLEDEYHKQSGLVIYIIDPFSLPSTSQNLRTFATIGLMKCYSTLLEQLPENLRRITQLQLISLDSIVSHSRPMVNLTRLDQLKSLSMNVYSRCKRIMTNQITAKSLTGFGPAAALEQFFKTKNPEICVSRMFTPPFILAPMKDKQTELGESYGHLREKSSVMFCSYCITEDQRWLLASVTNEKGELSESTVININIVDRMKRPKASVKRVALRKLMEFIVSVMSDCVTPWRLIIGKLGRVGHGELKEWATLMSKRSLLNYSRHLNVRCHQCEVLPPNETVSILSACLVSLEPDSKLRIMPDQFTSDDRQASFNKCPLSTPEDASATHILVFPTSASIQPNQGNVEDPLVGVGEDDLNFPLEDGIEDLGVEDNMDDIFSACNDFNLADQLSSHNDTLMSSSNLQQGSVSCVDGSNNQDETLQLLQQPLALGYYISTAKIGQMPNWFWSTVPHLRNSCPVYLKSALHIHMPYVQLSDDYLHSTNPQSRKSHQLDSHMTTDVLRYVLEGYNSLSWLALNPKNYDRQSCLPVHMQNLLQLYHLMESFS